jgi:hypothetical protein
MNVSAFRMSCMAVVLLAPLGSTIGAASAPSATEEGHLSGMMTRITLPDGATRTVKLEGVGCTASICSRAAIKGKAERESIIKTWFDTIAAIRDTTDSDALFVMKDGSQRRMSLIKDFRVLYIAGRNGAPEKLDLGKVKSIEFLPSTK